MAASCFLHEEDEVCGLHQGGGDLERPPAELCEEGPSNVMDKRQVPTRRTTGCSLTSLHWREGVLPVAGKNNSRKNYCGLPYRWTKDLCTRKQWVSSGSGKNMWTLEQCAL